jgi:hypothetical protein
MCKLFIYEFLISWPSVDLCTPVEALEPLVEPFTVLTFKFSNSCLRAFNVNYKK